MELNGGTGPIKHMISFGSFMEVYKADKTFRIRTPDSVDPSNSDPNAPWLVQDTAAVGCAHPIVARLIIQSRRFLKEVVVTRKIDDNAALDILHRAKEGLLACEAAMLKLHKAVHTIVDAVDAEGVRWSKDARAINPFPHVNDLEALCAEFLVKANRHVRTICDLTSCFVDLDRKHSNFDHLHKELEAKVGPDAPLTELVALNREFIRRIVELRNFEEHKGESRTVVHNFDLGPAPDYPLVAPSWEVQGVVVHPREDICRDSHQIIGGLLELTEWTVIYGVMLWCDPRFGHYVVEIDAANVDAACPVLYRPAFNLHELYEKPADTAE
ncbi:hypothetical protein [Niveibacterium sp.]|uniref:hypothetical protein n=1 Tax=Niveibacterium sp. TaxID=2017444 RepID=UPI0035AFA111